MTDKTTRPAPVPAPPGPTIKPYATPDSVTADKAPDAKAPDTAAAKPAPDEIGGPSGPEPTRYGDWERGGRCSDF